MVEEALVDGRIDAGERLIKALDVAGFAVKAALWLYYPDMERWRLVIAPKAKMTDLVEAYLLIVRSLRDLDIPADVLDSAVVNLVQPDDQLLSGISMFRVEGNARVRLRQNWLNGVYLEDALVYRNAA